MLTSAQIRQSFLDFFREKEHTIVPSSSLLPDSPNLLFTNAGMNQFVPIFLGERKPDVSKWAGAVPGSDTRAADTQKCIRAGGKHNDLEDVGLDTYHHTFFEMLGNWSFGDYFKKEAITWAWELVVDRWKFPPERLYATIYNPDKAAGDPAERDEEAWGFWAEKFRARGLDPAVHIVDGNKKDNFWMMGETGPCGPCSELNVDLTPNGDTRGSLVNAGDARCIEIWNLVFIQFNANPDGTFTPLPARHVDTGMGFERVCSIIQGTRGFTDFASAKISNYETDVFRPIFDELEKLSGKKYRSTLPTSPAPGGTGDSPVPLGDPPSGTEHGSIAGSGSESPGDESSRSAGPVAQQHGQVARATQASATAEPGSEPHGARYSKRLLPHFEKPWAIYHIIFQTIAARKLSPAARDIVFDCILRWRESRYRLVAACVMPDHVHFIIQPGVKDEDDAGNPIFWPLSEILHSIKSYSAKEINKLDNVRGTLWQDERYDRYVRGDADLQEKYRYVCENPWAAGLATEREEWPWLWTPEIEGWKPYVPLHARTGRKGGTGGGKGGTGDPPVPLGDPPSGRESAWIQEDAASEIERRPSSAGPVAQQHGQVARATQDPPAPDQIAIDIAFRVIADHIRTLSFSIADGIQPGNTDRNYVLRRILRRAVRYGRTLGFHEPFFYKLVAVLARTMGDTFPEVRAKQKQVEDVLKREEESFNKTLDRGLELFDREVEAIRSVKARIEHGSPYAATEVLGEPRPQLQANDLILEWERQQCGEDHVSVRRLRNSLWQQNAMAEKFSGEAAFVLADTYGFPFDLTELLSRERGLTVETHTFNQLSEERRQQSKGSRETQIIELSEAVTTEPTKFVGYDALDAKATVLKVVALKKNTALVLDTSPAYAEMGGQVGDTGEIASGGQLWNLLNTQKSGNTWLHLIEPMMGDETPADGTQVTISVDEPRRRAIERHHTVTHLLHWALHEVVSRDATQKGSFVGPEKLTFDFNSPALTPQQVREVERLVNARIVENAGVSWIEAPYAEIKSRTDVLQFFGDKYGETVRIVQIGGTPRTLDGFSMELCGGTHTRATGEIGLFRIVSEAAIAAGVRRIEAIAGLHAYDFAHAESERLKQVAGKVGAPVADIEKKIESLLTQQKELEKALKSAQQREAAARAKELLGRAETIGTVPAIIANLGVADADMLQSAADALKGQFTGAIVLGGAANGAVALVAAVSPDFTAKVQAGKIIQAIAPLVGGKGGGKPENARGGGKDPSQLDAALAQARVLLGNVGG